jgi:3-phosphoshikimate 1-carboxyvinyltransferase
MILAALSKGRTHFKHTERLKLKESDRLSVMIEILEKFGVTTILDGDDLYIDGQSTLKGHQTFDTYHDHRIAMSLMIASIKTDGPIIIKHIEVINKSYPTFLEVFKSIGGQYGIIK